MLTKEELEEVDKEEDDDEEGDYENVIEGDSKTNIKNITV